MSWQKFVLSYKRVTTNWKMSSYRPLTVDSRAHIQTVSYNSVTYESVVLDRMCIIPNICVVVCNFIAFLDLKAWECCRYWENFFSCVLKPVETIFVLKSDPFSLVARLDTRTDRQWMELFEEDLMRNFTVVYIWTLYSIEAVSYTHLTLPTILLV